MAGDCISSTVLHVVGVSGGRGAAGDERGMILFQYNLLEVLRLGMSVRRQKCVCFWSRRTGQLIYHDDPVLCVLWVHARRVLMEIRV